MATDWMGGVTVADVWACGQCRSINRRGDSRCYACKTPRKVAEVDPMMLSVTERAPVAKGQVGRYQPTIGLAVLTTILVVAAGVASVVTTVLNVHFVDELREGRTTGASIEAAINGLLGTLAVAMFAIVAWAAWLSRVVANLPALGLGHGRVSPRFVFVESLIPFYNIRRAHGIVTDILARIRPSPRDTLAVAFAWLPLVISIAVSALVFRFSIFFHGDWVVGMAVLVRQISVGLQLVSVLFLVALIWRVEARTRTRAAEVRQALAANRPMSKQ